MVSLRPAISTTDQWVVTKTWRGDGSLPVDVVPAPVACEDMLTPAD
jgi:hypothetical protein